MPTELLHSLIRLHVLHHAAQGRIYGQWMIEELARHGYRISPGALYPMLHSMERKGWLQSFQERQGRVVRKYYWATRAGKRALAVAKEKVRELFGELFEEELEGLRERPRPRKGSRWS